MRSRFSPEVRGAILQGLSAGLSLREAAEAAGIPPQLARNWLTRGRAESDTEHAAFAVAVDEARDVAARAPMGVGEFQASLNRAVRRGSIAAMRLWWQVNADEAAAAAAGAVDAGDPFARLDAAAWHHGTLASLDAAGPDFTQNHSPEEDPDV